MSALGRYVDACGVRSALERGATCPDEAMRIQPGMVVETQATTFGSLVVGSLVVLLCHHWIFNMDSSTFEQLIV